MQTAPDPNTPASRISKFVSELRQRHVFRVAAAYPICGWLVIQLANNIFPAFDFPRWTNQFVILLVLIGFPIALVLAWAFEITPKGIKTDLDVRHLRELDLEAQEKIKVSTEESQATPLLPEQLSGAIANKARINTKSIAVLPLANLSPNPDNAYFASGVHEDILDHLAKISDLQVISRTAVLRYRETTISPREIARELNVSTLLEGSVRFAGNRVKITTQLIRADDDVHIWSESYEFELDDIFAIQSDVAQKVALAMKATLLPGEKIDIERRATGSSEAYTLYLRHRYQYEREHARPTLAENGWIEAGIRKMEQAVDLDPLFARGIAELGWLNWYKGLISPLSEGNSLYDVAIYLSNKALRIDSTISRAYQVLERVHFHRRQWQEWESNARKSIALPDLDGSAAFNWALTLALIERYEESFYWFDIALGKCAYFPYYWETAISTRIGARDYETALSMAEKFREIGGDANSYRTIRAYTLNLLGRKAEFLREFALISSKPMTTVFIPQFYDFLRSQMGEKEQVMEELSRLPDNYSKESRFQYCAAGAGDIEAMFASFRRSISNEQFIYFSDLITEEVRNDPRWKEVEDFIDLPKPVLARPAEA